MMRSGCLLFAAIMVGAVSVHPAAAQTPATPPPANERQEQARAFVERFRAANTTHDGKLTRKQAEDANMTGLVRSFSAIDVQHKGYVTLEDIRAFTERLRGAAEPAATE